MKTTNSNGMTVKNAAENARTIVDTVQDKIESMSKEGFINFPPNYSVSNALRSAWLSIQETKDISKRPALEVCTRDSVANALLNTVIQGLNPAKKQIYYIVYGDQLQAQRSYFGTMAVTKRIPGVKDVYADVVYQNDTFEVSKSRGHWKIEKHDSSFENIDTDNIVASYCVIEFDDGREPYVEIMNRKQIETSWNRSKSKDHTTHKEFPDQMAKKTVINRACKNFMNSSDDSDLLIEAFNATGERYNDEPFKPEVSSRLEALNAEFANPPKERPVIEHMNAVLDEGDETNA